MKNNTAKQTLDLIDQSLENTKYVLDTNHRVDRIMKVICIWVLSYTIMNLLLFFTSEYAAKTMLFLNPYYFPVYRTIMIFVYLLLVIIYIFCLKKTNMTLKEKSFLKLWLVIPILFSVYKILPTILYFINFDVMLQFYSSFPLDALLITVGLIMLFSYSGRKIFLWSAIFNALYALFSLVFISSTMNAEYVAWQISVFTFLDFINTQSIYLSVTFLLIFIVFSIKKAKNETA